MSQTPPRVVFGAGSIARITGELDAIGVYRPLIVTTPGRTDTLALVRRHLGDRQVGVCDRAALHVPADRVREAIEDVDRLRPDALLSIGGGSAVGLAKAVALERRILIVAIPTTYAGSEMTSIWGMTEGEHKRTGRNPTVRPCLVIYDPELTLDLPAAVSAASGMNAMAHAVEAMWAARVSVETILAASTAIRSLAQALPRVVQQPSDIDARLLAFRGAHAAGVALELAPMGLHHKICHVLGGTFGLPHAETHAAVLPHVAAFNAPAVPEAMVRIADALGVDEAAAGLAALNRALGLTASLRDFGMREADLDRAAELIASSSYPNPRPATVADVRELLGRAL